MTIQVTGKNIEIGESFQGYIVEKTRNVLEKYIGAEISGQVTVAKERSQFQTSCVIRLPTGLLLEAKGEGADAYISADSALERLDKRVRRYKRRLKNHHTVTKTAAFSQSLANDVILRTQDEDVENEGENHEQLIVAETQRMISEMRVSEAVMQLDLTDEMFLVFRNASNGQTNVVYRRDDGNVGWIDPKLAE